MNPDIERPEGTAGRAIGIVESAARAVGARAFLVGGPVRDLLRGTSSRDIDITIEGDAERVVHEVAARTGATLRKIEPFLTYKVMPPGLPEIDIATARKERYARPGALPEVEPAAIGDDLVRRDYSINAIALELSSWTLLDPTDGVADLRRGILRALHAKSFIDDPTRILRGLRFAARFRLGWDPDTSRWLRDAINAGAMSTVSRERLWRELIFAASETSCSSMALLAIAGSGALENVFGILRDLPESPSLALFEREHEEFAASGADPVLVRLALLFAGSSPDAETLNGAPLKQRARDLLGAIARDARRHVRELSTLEDERSIYDALTGMTREERVLAALADPSARQLVDRFERACSTPIGISASDLGVPPGPWVGVARRATASALFTRAITPGEAATFARRAALDYLRGQYRRE